MHPVIRIEQLYKTYHLGENNRSALWSELKARFFGGKDRQLFYALRDISFDVQEGEIIGILGHNGAGKSTLLKILAQITSPTKGKVSLRGRVASLLEVGTGFHPELSGRDNIFLNGAILGMSRKEITGKLDEIVAFSGVEEFLDTPVKRYSSGMRVRLAFAVAAHLEPEILFIDEVLAVGDSAFQRRCVGKISENVNAGRTVLFVSHNAAVVEALCKRGIVLHHGQMVFDGTQKEALHYYTQLMDAAPESLHTRTDRRGSGELRVVAVEVRDSTGRPSQTVRCGEDVEIGLVYERHAAKEYPMLSVQISVSTELGTMVFAHMNQLTNTEFGQLPETGIITLRLPRFPLLPGNYVIDYTLKPSRMATEPIDGLTSAVRFTVQAGNFYGGGALPGGGLVVLDGGWRVDSVARKDLPSAEPAMSP